MEKLAQEINLVDMDIVEIHKFLKTDRFESGLKALEKWIKLGDLIVRAKQAWKKNAYLDNLSKCLDYDLKSLAKNDLAALPKISEAEGLKDWYIKTNRFMVSPRNILKEFENEGKEKKEKTELEKLLQTLETLGKQIDSYLFDSEQAKTVNDALKMVGKRKANLKEEKLEETPEKIDKAA